MAANAQQQASAAFDLPVVTPPGGFTLGTGIVVESYHLAQGGGTYAKASGVVECAAEHVFCKLRATDAADPTDNQLHARVSYRASLEGTNPSISGVEEQLVELTRAPRRVAERLSADEALDKQVKQRLLVLLSDDPNSVFVNDRAIRDAKAAVVNVGVAHIRPEHDNLREWCADPQNVYVGRRGVVFVGRGAEKTRYPPRDSPFANPFKIGKDGNRESVIAKYREYIERRLRDEPELTKELQSLRGKTLGCWCAPELCHAEILRDLADR